MIIVMFGITDDVCAKENLPLCTSERIQEIRVPYVDQLAKKNDTYFVALLRLALEKSAKCTTDFRVTYFNQKYSSKRFRAEIYKNYGLIDVYWRMATEYLDQDVRPIKIPLLQGMNGYRLLVIRREDQEKFKNIRTLGDLTSLTAGQASDWPDVPILRQNGLKVITSNDADLLYKMLSGRRFDYLPRGAHEAKSELELSQDESLMVCENLFLSYNAPVYFIVGRNRKDLADRITEGLEVARADGSFAKLFNSFPNFVAGLEEMKNPHRLKLELASPFFGLDK